MHLLCECTGLQRPHNRISWERSQQKQTLARLLAMSLWEARDHSAEAARNTLREEAQVVEACLELLAVCAAHLEEVPNPSVGSRVSAVCVIKVRNLGLASYSLSLDALAQESGAILRPLIETIELLEYLRGDAKRLDEALEGKLPSAGLRARSIGSRFGEIRRYLNDHASHFALSPESVRHLLNSETWKFRIVQTFNASVLRVNLQTLFAVLAIGMYEAVLAVEACDPENVAALAERGERIRTEGLRLFKAAS